MENGTKEAFEAMNFSTDQLEMALEAAKSSQEFQINDREMSQIEEMLAKLRGMFAEASKGIIQPRSERGNLQAEKTLLEQVASQYQAMNALVASMTQTLMGLEGVRDKFDQIFGGAGGVAANAENAQRAPGAAQIQLRGMFDSTSASLQQYTESFKDQLNEQLAIYEAIGAEYYQMMAAIKFVPNAPKAPEAPKGDDANNGTDPTDNPDNPDNPDGDTSNPAGSGENPEEQQGSAVPLGGVAMAGSSGAAAPASGAPSGGEQQTGSAAATASGAPAGGASTTAAPSAGGAEHQGSAAAAPQAAQAPQAPTATAQHTATHSATAHTNAQDRGRSDERQKKKNSTKKQ